jgi:hypothetical protein
LRYRIKSDAEIYERNVLECQLSADVGSEGEYATPIPRLSKAHADIEITSFETVAGPV